MWTVPLKPGTRALDFKIDLLGPIDDADSAAVSQSIALVELLEKGPAVLVFVKEGCPTCQYTLPFLEKMYQSYPQSKVSIVVIAQEEASAASRMVHNFGIPTTPILLDPEPCTLSAQYKLVYVPTFFYVGQDREIKMAFESFNREEFKSLNEVVAQANRASPRSLFSSGEGVPSFRPG